MPAPPLTPENCRVCADGLQTLSLVCEQVSVLAVRPHALSVRAKMLHRPLWPALPLSTQPEPVSGLQAGLVWCVWWERVMAGIRDSEPEVAAQLLPPPEEATEDSERAADRGTPWRGFLRSGPVRPAECP